MPTRFSARIETIFADKDRGMHRARRRMVERTAEFTRDRAAHHTPVANVPEGVTRAEFIEGRGRVPGTAKKSWRVGELVVERDGEHITMDVYSIDPLIELIEFPTQPHLIVPKNAGGVLAFTVNGKTVFATLVHHPGTRGAFMLTTAIREGEVEMQRIMREELDAWARGAYD